MFNHLRKPHYLTILISFLVHLPLLVIVPKLKMPEAKKVLNKKPPLRIRTIGERKGHKNTFSTPLSKAQVQKSLPTPNLLKQLGEISRVSDRDFKKLKSKKISKKMEKQSNTSLKLETGQKLAREIRRRQAQQTVLDNIKASPESKKILDNKDLDLTFTPPKGVSKDELNSIEKIFYSFNVRTYQKYVNSFLSTYNRILVLKPYVKKTIEGEKHRLIGRIVFDSMGNIQAIKIVKSSLNDDIHQLFEETLKELRKLPNPPKALLQEDGTFTMFFALNVN